jgi:acyl-CoA synthetase (AMP-forming)/AMP-acid ligase II/NAD(P)-dependent dehydrogenase (short-subunit alcohol dehydrogenase family)
MGTAIIEGDLAAGHALQPPGIPDLTLPEFVLAQAARRGSKQALADAATGRGLSYAELAAAVQETGARLAGRGLHPGDVLALCAPNSIEFATTWFAAASIGAIVTTVNPECTGAEICRQLQQTGARYLLTTSAQLAGKLRPAIPEAGIAEPFVIGEAAAGATAFQLLRMSAGPDAAPVSASGVAFLPSSSGTTGLPKTVVLTHRNLVASLCQMRLAHKVTEDDVVIAALPLFHIYGLQVTLNLALLQGATVVILPRFEPEAFLRAVQERHVTRAEVVPPIVLGLARAEVVGHYDLSSLRLLTSAAAPLGAELARACARRIGCRVKQAYGMTELGGATHIAPDDGPDRPESIGPALPGIECRVVSPETGTSAGPGEPGELLIRSPGAMLGYLGNPLATAATIDTGGWVHTGDIVTVDAAGWYRVTDRVKELIKYKGHQVAPAELEGLLLTHPAVADAAVVRSPDQAAGEVPKAFVVLRAPATAAELMAWVAERVAPYKRVRQIEFTDRIPTSPSGKILRRHLVDRERRAVDQPRARTVTVRPAGRPATATAGGYPADHGCDLDGMVALVSGGGRGIGRLLAASLAEAGAAVGLIARSPAELATAVAEIQSTGRTAAAATADVTDYRATAAAVAQLRQQLGSANLLINNAGISGPAGLMWDADPAQWWRTLEINLGGAFALTRIALPDMIAAGDGRIINITSYAGAYRWPLMSAYAASKAALVKLTETLAAETRAHGVSVFSVDPGLLPIGLGEVALSSTADRQTPEGRVFGWIRDRLASGHGTDPERAARVILTLAGGRADRLTGRHLTVTDDIDALLDQIECIERDDLQTLRLRTRP